MKGSAGLKVVILRADSGTLSWSSGRSSRWKTNLLKTAATSDPGDQQRRP